MEVWEWVSNVDPNSVLNTLGLGALAFLFARDLILTKGQHLRRIADLVEHHQRELAEKDARLAVVDESRREWKAAAAAQSERADKATSTMAEVADSLDGVHYVLKELVESLKEARRG